MLSHPTCADRYKTADLLDRLAWHIAAPKASKAQSGISVTSTDSLFFADEGVQTTLKILDAKMLLAGAPLAPGAAGFVQQLLTPVGQWDLPDVPLRYREFCFLEKRASALQVSGDALQRRLELGPDLLDAEERQLYLDVILALKRLGEEGKALYGRWRLDLIEHPVRTVIDFHRAASGLPADVREALEDFYRPVVITSVVCCAHCGFPLEKTLGFCTTPACDLLRRKTKQVSFEGREKVMWLKDVARLFWHAPGVAERLLGQQLERAGAEVTWYPEFDSYDFKVEAPGVHWAIDVKDHHRYEDLDPLDFGGLDLMGFERFVVVPDHRLRYAPGAVEIVAARCSSAGITACSASDLVKRFKEALR